MKPMPSLLSPLLRSDTQGRILAALYLFPERELTVSSLAKKADTSPSTVTREVDRMVESEFLNARVSGRNRYVSVNVDHPLFKPVAEVVRYAYGPLAILPGVVSGLKGMQEASIYGSWAARLNGEPGPDPSDIDVVVVGDIDRMAAYDAAQAATIACGRPVNIRAVATQDWREGSDLFLKSIRGGPLVRLPVTLSDGDA